MCDKHQVYKQSRDDTASAAYCLGLEDPNARRNATGSRRANRDVCLVNWHVVGCHMVENGWHRPPMQLLVFAVRGLCNPAGKASCWLGSRGAIGDPCQLQWAWDDHPRGISALRYLGPAQLEEAICDDSITGPALPLASPGHLVAKKVPGTRRPNRNIAPVGQKPGCTASQSQPGDAHRQC